MATIKTKWFSSTMAGAPALSGSVGAMIAVLDACLKDGFSLNTLTSLVIASNVATATKAGHPYVVNQVLEVAGITGACAALNGNVRVTSITTDTFNFVTSGLSDQTATGTITAKVAAAGWEKQFSGTNMAVYRSGNLLSSRQCIKVDDTVGQYSTVRGAEQFTDISTEVNGFATQYFKKSNATDANARPWLIIADDLGVYLGIQWTNAGVYDFTHFGDFTSYVAGDAANFRLQGLTASNPTTIGQFSSVNNAYSGSSQVYGYASRSYAQIVTPTILIQASLIGAVGLLPGTGTGSYSWALSGYNGFGATLNYDPYPAPGLADNGYHFFPTFLFESVAYGKIIRGAGRGVMHVLETLPQASNYSILSAVENIQSGLVLMARSAGYITQGSVCPAATIAFSLGDW